MKLPNKFEFKCGNGRTIYTWHGDRYSFYDCGHECSSNFDVESAVQAVAEGHWVITKDLDEPIKTAPELVFPFTFEYYRCNTLYTAVRENDDGSIHIIWEGDSTDSYCVQTVKEFIKGGDWLVKSVGGQQTKSDPACVHEYFWGDMSEAEGEHNPVVPSEVGPLTIKIDSSQIIQATEAIHNLGEAIDKVKTALYGLNGVWREANGLGERVECVGGGYKVDYKFLGE